MSIQHRLIKVTFAYRLSKRTRPMGLVCVGEREKGGERESERERERRGEGKIERVSESKCVMFHLSPLSPQLAPLSRSQFCSRQC